MTQYHDLRKALAHRIGVNVIPEFVIDPASITPIIDIFLAVLADPHHRLEILEAMGLDVTEGRERGGIVYLAAEKRLGFRDDAGVWHDYRDATNGYWVRPRGETSR